MLTQILKTVTVAAAFAAVSAYAQTDRIAEYKVPFAFTAGKHTFAAGNYTVYSSFGRAALTIRSLDCRSSAVLLTLHAQTKRLPERSQLVFHRYGDEYFLSQVWHGGTDAAQALPPGPREAESARKAGAPQVATLMATQPGQ